MILEIYKIPGFGAFDGLIVDDWPIYCCDSRSTSSIEACCDNLTETSRITKPLIFIYNFKN